MKNGCRTRWIKRLAVPVVAAATAVVTFAIQGTGIPLTELPPDPFALFPPLRQEEISLAFVGDIMQHQPQVQAARSGNDFDYTGCFRRIAPYLNTADFVIGNLETPLSNGNYSGYPCFSAPWQIARDLRRSGFRILLTANNHVADRGKAGIDKTLHYLDSLQIAHLGSYADTADALAQSPLILQKNGFKIALLNYTYGTNGLPVPAPRVVDRIDTTWIFGGILRAKAERATHIVVAIHWGDEYQTQPNAAQKELARWLHSKGVDVIIGSHPHVVQPIEFFTRESFGRVDTTGFVAYSLGNFISNQSLRYTNAGIALRLTLRREQGKTAYEVRYLNHYCAHKTPEGRYIVVPEPLVDALPPALRSKASAAYRDNDSVLRRPALKYYPSPN